MVSLPATTGKVAPAIRRTPSLILGIELLSRETHSPIWETQSPNPETLSPSREGESPTRGEQ